MNRNHSKIVFSSLIALSFLGACTNSSKSQQKGTADRALEQKQDDNVSSQPQEVLSFFVGRGAFTKVQTYIFFTANKQNQRCFYSLDSEKKYDKLTDLVQDIRTGKLEADVMHRHYFPADFFSRSNTLKEIANNATGGGLAGTTLSLAAGIVLWSAEFVSTAAAALTPYTAPIWVAGSAGAAAVAATIPTAAVIGAVWGVDAGRAYRKMDELLLAEQKKFDELRKTDEVVEIQPVILRHIKGILAASDVDHSNNPVCPFSPVEK